MEAKVLNDGLTRIYSRVKQQYNNPKASLSLT